jgi:hypothetical protein
MNHNNRKGHKIPPIGLLRAGLPSIGFRGGVVDANWNRSAPAFGNFREREVELAVDQSGLSTARVTRPRGAYGSGKSTEVALDEMKRQLGPWSLDALFAHDEQQIAFGEDADSRRINPRHVDDDFDRLVPLVHVDGGGAFSRERLRVKAAAELGEDPTNVLRKVGGFRVMDTAGNR